MKSLYRIVIITSQQSYVVYQKYRNAYCDHHNIMTNNITTNNITSNNNNITNNVTFIYFYRINYWWLDNILYLHIAGKYSDYYKEEENSIHVINNGNMFLKYKVVQQILR